MRAPDNHQTPRPPTLLANRFVRYVIGFSVGIVIGLLPFLGLINVPGFNALLSLFPSAPIDMRTTIIPLSSFLMGVVAVVLQFNALETLTDKKLRGYFRNTLWIMGLAFVALLVLHTLTVEKKVLDGGRNSVSILLGFSRPPPPECECEKVISNSQCLDQISLDPSEIRSCWGDRQINFTNLALSGTYLALTGGFGALIGTLILWEARRQQPKRR